MLEKLINIGIKAKKASKIKVDRKNKNKVLKKYLQLINKNKKNILKENNKDIKFAIKNNLPENLISRLALNDKKITDNYPSDNYDIPLPFLKPSTQYSFMINSENSNSILYSFIFSSLQAKIDTSKNL